MTLSAIGSWDAAVPFLLGMGTPPQGGAAGLISGLVPFALVLGIFYFIILLPMRRKQQKVDAFLAALKVGDRIVTSGGIFGSITGITDQAVQLQIADKVRVQVSRSAIVGYQGQEPVVTEGQS